MATATLRGPEAGPSSARGHAEPTDEADGTEERGEEDEVGDDTVRQEREAFEHVFLRLFVSDERAGSKMGARVAGRRHGRNVPKGTNRPTLPGQMSQQRIRYLRTSDGVRVAWAEAGSGPVLVKASNWLTHLEYDWQSPVWRHWIRFLSGQLPLRALRRARAAG